jgi:hypothetical protein
MKLGFSRLHKATYNKAASQQALNSNTACMQCPSSFGNDRPKLEFADASEVIHEDYDFIFGSFERKE